MRRGERSLEKRLLELRKDEESEQGIRASGGCSVIALLTRSGSAI